MDTIDSVSKSLSDSRMDESVKLKSQ